MRRKEIRKVFREAGIKIPAYVEDRIGSDYNSVESWCCGLLATQVDGGVLVQSYCKRGRGGDKSQFLIHADGSCEELDRLPADWF